MITTAENKRSVAFYTLGCKLNFSETSTIARQFQEGNYAIKDFEEPADVYVINTCSVTDHADKKTKKYVKDALGRNPYANVVVIGCYAQLKPQEILNIPGVNLVLGAKEKFNILEHVNTLSNGCEPAIFNTPIKEANTFQAAYSVGDRTRSFLKVQDGCNYFCAFCTIPLARGFSRSSQIDEVVKAAKEIAEKGVKEIVLTGVNIGDFQNDKGEDFYALVQELDKVEGIERFRISSIEPNLLTNDIIKFVSQSKKFVPHFHIPLQSGSDKMLELMRRRYKRELYAERVAYIKELMPNACIGVDVITGFPSETDDDFLDTYSFINELPVSYLHVFTYSERPNTTAVRIKGKVPNRIRLERNKMLQILSEKKKRAFYEEHINTSAKVLWEHERNGEFMFGFTDNYLKVKALYDASKSNTIETIQLGKMDDEGLMLPYIDVVKNALS
ncbi:MAG: tRNA (N(6)-L-threonylcarbamoyladenosine(37)-C(2))-methylthiotransferase MtaB [Bacteroidia bacterium]